MNFMKYIELKKIENQILSDFDTGRLKQVKNARKEIARYMSYAKSTLNKTRNINIRLAHRDLQKLKALATEKGLPYQTFLSSLLHQYSAKKEI